MTALPQLVLASGSPRRRELLAGLGLRPLVRPADIDEQPLEAEPPADYVLRLARTKATTLAHPGELVLAADTTVALGNEILGKPEDAADAGRMLRQLAGREHEVLTGVAVFDPAADRLVAEVDIARVRFAAMTDAEVAWYVATGEPLDKAGAYGIQGAASLFIEALEGTYSNVVGLPLPLLYHLVRAAGYDLLRLAAGAAGRQSH